MSKIYAGIDYSMNSPAICVWDSSKEFCFNNLIFHNYGKTKSITGSYNNNISIMAQQNFQNNEPRFRELSLWAKAVLQMHQVTDICLEDYAFGSKSNSLFQIGENTGLLKQVMYDLGIEYQVVKPTQVKSYFAAKGNAKKEEMVDKFNDIFDLQLHSLLKFDKDQTYKKPVDDLVDSCAILLCHSDLEDIRLQIV